MKAIDIAGHRFGRLVAVQKVFQHNGAKAWLCQCDCGGSVEATASRLRNGDIKSCGCLKHKNLDDWKETDLSGMRFHFLVAAKATSPADWGWMNWLCNCDCGGEIEVSGYSLFSGRAISCGCRRGKGFVHKGCINNKEEPVYELWHRIKQRCYRVKNDNYAIYGGRGITVCDEWLNDYSAFREWAVANGYKKGLHIDRIDNDGPYSPGNCQFLTPTENTRKQSQVKLTPRKVLVIRKLLSRTSLTHKEIGSLFGISRTAVGSIKTKKNWADITEADWKKKC